MGTATAMNMRAVDRPVAGGLNSRAQNFQRSSHNPSEVSLRAEIRTSWKDSPKKATGVFERTNEYFKNMKSRDVNDPEFDIKEEVAKARWEKYASIT